MLKLYMAPNSICTQKVLITLAEKGLEYQCHELNLFRNEQYDPAYLKLNPKGVVPTLLDGDKVIVESTLICEYLDDAFPEPRLIPADPYQRTQMRLWSKAIDEGVFEATREISFSAMFREKLKTMSEAQRHTRFRNVGDPGRRARYISTFEQGVDSPYVFQAIAAYENLFKAMQKTLSPGGPWLLGRSVSLADISVMPCIARLEYLDLLDLWLGNRGPVMAWWRRARRLKSFKSAISGPLGKTDVANMRIHGTNVRDRLRERRLDYLLEMASGPYVG